MGKTILVVLVVIVASGVYYLKLVFERQRVYEEVVEVYRATQPYRDQVEKALRSKTPMPAPAAPPRNARAMSARPDGTIVVEISEDLVPGARLTLRPHGDGTGVEWTCSGEGLRHVPAACR